MFPQLSLTSNGWSYNEQLNMVLPFWFDGPQFSPSVIMKKNKSKYKLPVEGYEADLENTEKILRPSSKSLENQVNVISEQETSNKSACSETDDKLMSSVIQEEELNLFSEST